MPKDILALVDGSVDCVPFLKRALDLAASWDSHIVAAVLCPSPVVEMVTPGGMPILDFGDIQRRFDALAAENRDRVAAVVAQSGVPAEIRSITGDYAFLPDEAGLWARYADLTLVGPPSAYCAPPQRQLLAEAVIFRSGRPLLLVPETPVAPVWRKVAVAWNATREANRALHDALPFLAPNAEIEVLVLDPKSSSQQHGEDPGVDIARHLARLGHRATVRTATSDGKPIGKAIADAAAGADLLVMGAYSHSRARETILGGATRTLLNGCAVPILMGH